MKPRSILAALALGSLAAPLAAESSSTSFQTRGSGASASTGNPLAQFVPAGERREHRIDYQHWDEALGWFVVPMGPSIRETPGRVEARTGTRRIYGHESRFRLEGNRVAFSFIPPDMREAIGTYRADLERIGSELDLTSLPRNEQLAFWLNLHNVAMIEALAGEYPLSEPHGRTFGSNTAPLDDAKLVTIKGVELSPRDIRERIVYPNWKDPKVMYGFWRGVIGGPSIQRLAFTGGNVDPLLALSAEEFVNSLRGVESWGGALRVSPLYEEAAPFYFSDFDAVRSHLAQYAADDVKTLLNSTSRTTYKPFASDLADLSRGERETVMQPFAIIQCGGVCNNNIGFSDAIAIRTRPNLAIQRLMIERQKKLEKAARRGIRTGMVIYGDGEYSEGEAPKEVE